jgi:hypothetical protein
MAEVTEITGVRWNNIGRKAIVDSITETTEDGRYSSMKNKKASWTSAVAIFNAKTGPHVHLENSCVPTTIDDTSMQTAADSRR